ncbi:ribonuclease Z [Rubrivirga litoralis]|uniref:Ribonuclease Z n=1 Tax=Rubrivirga litoralis TaxID=3075598 RepID=A0ABU3BN18_9BACT|nr:ribonuclease Z [Rubrivirga sp. F394]MDT0630676.1 ribonuclease Z [Rubrivirga sp. F394]
MFHVVPLGTGSALPTKTRHLAGTVVRREGRSVLFDCGEGSQLQLVRGDLTRGRLDAVCITHLHGDHFFGLPGLLTTLALLEREDPLTIVGPPGLASILGAIPGFGDGGPYEIRYVELEEGFEHAVVYEDEHVTIEARPLEHRVFCAGFRYQEKERPGSIDGEGARASGVTEGWQYEALKRGEAVDLEGGGTLAPDGLVGPPKPGAAFAYVLDTVPCDGGRALADRADLLMHEATFTDEHAERAADVGHSTARQAAEVARDAHAGRLLITHFSARYTDAAPLVAEAREVFENADAAEELERYEVRR